MVSLTTFLGRICSCIGCHLCSPIPFYSVLSHPSIFTCLLRFSSCLFFFFRGLFLYISLSSALGCCCCFLFASRPILPSFLPPFLPLSLPPLLPAVESSLSFFSFFLFLFLRTSRLVFSCLPFSVSQDFVVVAAVVVVVLKL